MDAAGPKPVGPLTLMEGAEGVTEIEGGLNLDCRAGADGALIEMTGILGVTEIEGALNLLPRAGAGASLMEMVGTLGMTEIVGMLVLPDLLAAGTSLTEILGIGGVTPTDGTLTPNPRLGGPFFGTEGVSEIDMVGIRGPGAVFERREDAW